MVCDDGCRVSVNLEHRFKWPSLLAIATTLAEMFAIGIPWWRWAYPAIERALLQASQGALRTGFAVVGITVIVLIAPAALGPSCTSDGRY